MKAQSSKTYRMHQMKSYSDTVSPQEGRKITDLRKPDVILKGPEKEQAKLRVAEGKKPERSGQK